MGQELQHRKKGEFLPRCGYVICSSVPNKLGNEPLNFSDDAVYLEVSKFLRLSCWFKFKS